MRLERAEMEMRAAPSFDAVIVNDVLETAVAEALARVEAFVERV